MNLINFNSLSPAKHALDNLLDDFFNSSIGDLVGADFVNSIPSVNSIETETDIKIELAAPGLEKKDFKIDINKDQLTISASKEQSSEDEHYKRREYNYASFTRSFALPETIIKDEISAKYENGVLGITLPKKTAAKAEGSKTIVIE